MPVLCWYCTVTVAGSWASLDLIVYLYKQPSITRSDQNQQLPTARAPWYEVESSGRRKRFSGCGGRKTSSIFKYYFNIISNNRLRMVNHYSLLACFLAVFKFQIIKQSYSRSGVLYLLQKK